MKDLAGQRFGRLVALEPAERRSRGLVVWRCRCDCGREVEVVGASLTKGNTRSCGCLQRESHTRDITGERFGRLTVVRATEKRHRGSVVWECACDCGNTTEVATSLLRAGQVRSCGCLRRDANTRDLAGRRFGRLTAVRPVGRKNRYILWECKCDCGNTIEATTGMLTAGKVKSCGCLRAQSRKQRPNAPDNPSEKPPSKNRTHNGKDLAGQRFGRLTAVRRVGSRGGYALWECACDCGNAARVTTNQLTSGHVRSCGCLRHEGRGENLAGRRFGDLVAAEPTGRREHGSVVWRCLCDCGRSCEMSAARLKRLQHPTCGHHLPEEQ